jgi:hypothetical protein
VSEDCRNILTRLGGFILQERGLTYLKVRLARFAASAQCVLTNPPSNQGKGEKRTYWLLGHCTLSTNDLNLQLNSQKLSKAIGQTHVL